MYRKRLFRRRMLRAGLVLMALALLAPKVDLAANSQLATLISAVGLGTVSAG